MIPDTVNQRVKSVLAAKSTDFVVEKVLGDDLDRMEQARKEEQRARMNALARAAASSGDEPRGSDLQKGAIEQLRDEEDCPVCQKILDSVAQMDEPKRTKGIAQYGEFRAAIEKSEQAAIDSLEGNDVLREALSNIRGLEL